MRAVIIFFILFVLSQPVICQEAPVLRYRLWAENNVVNLMNDQPRFATNLGALKLYAPGRKVQAQWVLVRQDGTVYGWENREYWPDQGSYENSWKPLPSHQGFRLDADVTPGRYWFAMSENGKPFFAEWMDVKARANGELFLMPAHAEMVSLHFGDDAKGEMKVGLTHRDGSYDKPFDLALNFDGKRVAWLPGGQPRPARAYNYTTFSMSIPRKLSNGTWLFDTNVERKHMVDGNWSLDLIYEGQVARSYPFRIKDWMLVLQGRQKESATATRKVVDPYYWWLFDKEDSESPPPFTLPPANGSSWS